MGESRLRKMRLWRNRQRRQDSGAGRYFRAIRIGINCYPRDFRDKFTSSNELRKGHQIWASLQRCPVYDQGGMHDLRSTYYCWCVKYVPSHDCLQGLPQNFSHCCLQKEKCDCDSSRKLGNSSHSTIQIGRQCYSTSHSTQQFKSRTVFQRFQKSQHFLQA